MMDEKKEFKKLKNEFDILRKDFKRMTDFINKEKNQYTQDIEALHLKNDQLNLRIDTTLRLTDPKETRAWLREHITVGVYDSNLKLDRQRRDVNLKLNEFQERLDFLWESKVSHKELIEILEKSVRYKPLMKKSDNK